MDWLDYIFGSGEGDYDVNEYVPELSAVDYIDPELQGLGDIAQYALAPEEAGYQPWFNDPMGEAYVPTMATPAPGPEPSASPMPSGAAPMSLQREGERGAVDVWPRSADPGMARGGNPITTAIKRMTATPGRSMQSLAGLGSIAAVAGGLASGGSRTSKIQMSPEEKAARDALTAQRARLSGTMASRGYAGEEGIRQKLNQQIDTALSGDTSLISPETQRQYQEEKAAYVGRLGVELGPGWELSTAGGNALRNFERRWDARFEAEKESRLASRNTMAMQRADFANRAEMQPGQLAAMELGTLSGMAERQADRSSANRRGLFQLGGNLAGMALAPEMYRAMLEAYTRPKVA